MAGRNGNSITIDRNHDIPVYSPVCSYCRHLQPDPGRVCKAFPNGIPLEIWLGLDKHSEALPGDNGIRFERALPLP